MWTPQSKQKLMLKNMNVSPGQSHQLDNPYSTGRINSTISNVRDSTDSFDIKESSFLFKPEGAEDPAIVLPDKGHESLMSMISKKHLIRKSLEQYSKEIKKTPVTSRQCSPKL